MIKFLPLDILGMSHKIPWKIKSAVYRLQISALDPEIFKFEKCVKYANKMTDDVIHSTQILNLKYINRDILANLQRRPLKLGRLIVLHKNTYGYESSVSMATLFQPPPTWFQYLSDSKCRATNSANIFLYLLDHTPEAPFPNMKMER